MPMLSTAGVGWRASLVHVLARYVLPVTAVTHLA